MRSLRGRHCWLLWVSLCCLRGRAGLSSQLPASAWPSPAFCEHLGTKPEDGRSLLIYLSLYIPEYFFKKWEILHSNEWTVLVFTFYVPWARLWRQKAIWTLILCLLTSGCCSSFASMAFSDSIKNVLLFPVAQIRVSFPDLSACFSASTLEDGLKDYLQNLDPWGALNLS